MNGSGLRRSWPEQARPGRPKVAATHSLALNLDSPAGRKLRRDSPSLRLRLARFLAQFDLRQFADRRARQRSAKLKGGRHFMRTDLIAQEFAQLFQREG